MWVRESPIGLYKCETQWNDFVFDCHKFFFSFVLIKIDSFFLDDE